MSPSRPRDGAGSARSIAIAAALRSRKAGGEEGFRVAAQEAGIGDDGVAQHDGPLDRLDQPVNVLEGLGAPDAEALEQAEVTSEASPCVGGGEL